MDAVTAALLNTLLSGGNGAIVAMLMFICYALWMERLRLIREHDIAQQRLDKVATAQMESAAAIVAAVNRVGDVVGSLRRSGG